MNDQVDAEEKERLQQELRILGRIIARAHLRSLGYSMDGLAGGSDVQTPSENANDVKKNKKSNRRHKDTQGGRNGKNGDRSEKQER